eukprot:TRINITY_DN1758_c0_g1_i12.p1 TRINITY_DN1758_c0_g1~~TRINITY_DN1758_c0_g1_i12.p1  ORF type:complete len:345 (-),score=2.73 TRINITY_DN1758_c0_g1_i12:280-1314(-)
MDSLPGTQRHARSSNWLHFSEWQPTPFQFPGGMMLGMTCAAGAQPPWRPPRQPPVQSIGDLMHKGLLPMPPQSFRPFRKQGQKPRTMRLRGLDGRFHQGVLCRFCHAEGHYKSSCPAAGCDASANVSEAKPPAAGGRGAATKSVGRGSRRHQTSKVKETDPKDLYSDFRARRNPVSPHLKIRHSHSFVSHARAPPQLWNYLPEPSDRPSEPSDRPSEPSDRPSEPSDRPSEPSDRPSEPSDRPSEHSELRILAVRWLRGLLEELHLLDGKTTFFVDNANTLLALKDPTMTKRTRHYDIKLHSARQQQEHIDFESVETTQNVADIFTKALPYPALDRHRKKLGLQ